MHLSALASRLHFFPLRLAAALLTLFSALPLGHLHAAEPAAAPAAALYRCPMHPAVTSEKPGKCTICGMALVASSAPTASSSTSIFNLSPSSITAIGVETAVVSRQPLTRTLRVIGRIEDDDTRHRILSARVPGRVEKLHLNYVGAPVAAGEPLATLYSPEVATAQRVYVERLRAGTDAFPASERAAARERLLELGLSPDDLAALEKNLTPATTVVIRAPSAGTVVAKSVYEGQYVQPADRLFEVADFSRMWFVFEAFAQDIPWLQVGQTVEFTTRAVPGETIAAPIEFIDPNFDELRQTARVRAALPNPHYSVGGQPHTLPHRVLAEGRVVVSSPAVLAAPRAAVLDRGTGPLAYVDRGEHHYEARVLTLGRRGDALVEVLSGLSEGDRVVTHAALLLDAQAQLTAEAPTHAHAAPASAPGSTAAAAASDLTPLATAASDSAAALAADDFAAYQKLFPSLVAAAKPFASLPALKPGTDLKSARDSFEPWSTAVADLLKPHRAHLRIKIYQCPMSPVLKTGRWVQRGEPLKNPFYGATMADCGDEVP